MENAAANDTQEVLITFTFLCFDADNRRDTDADVVHAVSPQHAAQEYVAALERESNAVNREPYIVAVRPEFREGHTWDLWKVTPRVTVEYQLSPPAPDDVNRIRTKQLQPALPPLQMRPPEHRAPDGHKISRDPADDILGL
jgi:hypothetical protein